MSGEKNGQIAFSVGLLAGSIATYLVTSKNKTITNAPKASTARNDAASIQSMPDEIRSEMLSRNNLYFESSNGMPDITNACVLVVGL